MKSKSTGMLMCLIAVLAWGGMFPIMEAALRVLDPFYFTLLRYGFVAVIFAGLLLVIEGPKAFKPEKHGIKLWLLGTAAFAGFSFLVFLGQKLAGASGSVIASVMMAIQPLLGVIVAWGWHRVKPPVFSLVAMVVAAIGVFMVVTKGNIGSLLRGSNTLVAAGLILLGALCWVIYTAGGADFSEWSILRYSALTTIYGMVSVVVIIALATLVGWLRLPTIHQIQGVSGALVYMVILAGVIAVFAWNFGNRIIGSINGILFMNLVPVTSFIISVLGGYHISSFELIGCLFTIVALIVNNLCARKKMDSKSYLEEEN